MFRYQKKREQEQQEDEELNNIIDFDYLAMMMRVEFLIPDADIFFYTYGQYVDMFEAYKYIHNMRVKKMIFTDAEKEVEAYRQAHRKIDSVFSI